MVFTYLCIQIVTIRFYFQNLIYKYITHHYTHEKSGTINRQNAGLIRRAITDFNWDRAFLSTSMSEKGSIFSNTILNILSNFIPHETIVCGDKDPHGLISNQISNSRKKTFKKYSKSNNNIQLLHRLRFLQEKLNSFITVFKQNYYSRMSTKLTKFD